MLGLRVVASHPRFYFNGFYWQNWSRSEDTQNVFLVFFFLLRIMNKFFQHKQIDKYTWYRDSWDNAP